MPIVPIKDLRSVLPPKSRLLGMDHGGKTLGLALSNPELTISTPLKTLHGDKFTENLRQLAAICKEYEVRGFVIGLPFNMDGTEGKRAESVRTFATNLIKAKDTLGFEPAISFFDERLSTYAVEQFMIDEMQMSRKKRDKQVDRLAAAHILENALKEMNKKQ